MRLFVILFAFTLFLGSTELFSQDLDTYQPTKRILLLKDTDLDSDWLKAQLKRLKSNTDQFTEREVFIVLLTDKFVYTENRVLVDLKADEVIAKYKLSDFEGLVLVGKDRTVKLQEEFIVSPAKILDLIDSMPMRIAELKN